MKTPGCGKVHVKMGIPAHHENPREYNRQYHAWRMANDPAFREAVLKRMRAYNKNRRTQGWR